MKQFLLLASKAIQILKVHLSIIKICRENLYVLSPISLAFSLLSPLNSILSTFFMEVNISHLFAAFSK